jgi:predicted nucleic acid-binding Zn ribbon protein
VLPAVIVRLKQRHKALRAIQLRWRRLVGKPLAAHTRPVSLRRGRLVVAVDRPGDGFLLSYQRARVLGRLQAETRCEIRDIVIRPSDGLPH